MRKRSVCPPVPINSVVSPKITLAPTFAAIRGPASSIDPTFLENGLDPAPSGNASGNGTAIQQVLTNQVMGPDEQLPNPFSGPIWSNINKIEFVTAKSPDYIFENYIRNLKPAARTYTVSGAPIPSPNPYFDFVDGQVLNQPINVIGSEHKIDIFMKGVAGQVQDPFSVETKRFDPLNNVMSVVTLKGHPLAGWRYWRVYSIGQGDVVVETGAYDGPGPGPKNYLGYYFAVGTISDSWRQFLLYIKSQKNDLGPAVGIQPALPIGDSNSFSAPAAELLRGIWNHNDTYKDYILNNVCQASTCN